MKKNFLQSLKVSINLKFSYYQNIIEIDNTQVTGFIRNNTAKGIHARRLSRWQTLPSYYNFMIVHIKGSDNYLTDFLSINVEYIESHS